MSKQKRVVGVDFGTSTTLIASREGAGEPRVIPIGRTTPWLPSIVGVGSGGELLTGEAAAALPIRDQIRSAKAALTAGIDSVSAGATEVPTREAIGALLSEAVARARSVDRHVFDDCRVYLGCPALWTGVERRLLADVAFDAGLEVDVSDIIDEPVAAGLHAVHSRWASGLQRIGGKAVVLDAGGGTLDIAYLEVLEGNTPTFTVLSAEGIPRSGDALDEAIAARLGSQVAGSDDEALQQLLLRLRAREMKEALSFDMERTTPLGEPFTDVLHLRREGLEESFDPLLGEAANLVMSTVRGSQLRVAQPLDPSSIRQLPWSELGDGVLHVVLAGGMSQVPAFADRMRTVFVNAEVAVIERPQEAIALGLARSDQLDRLNLPRPPVTFMVEFGPPELVARLGMPRQVPIYEAFTPLYSWSDLIMRSQLYYTATAPPPPTNEAMTCRLTAVAPDRLRTPLQMTRRTPDGTQTGSGYTVSHTKKNPARFTLFTNGVLVFSGAKGEEFRVMVDGWPHLRGPRHDWDLEIKMSMPKGEKFRSELDFDDWRFN